jgi:hypothetical protein
MPKLETLHSSMHSLQLRHFLRWEELPAELRAAPCEGRGFFDTLEDRRMAKKPLTFVYWVVILGSFFLANFAAQHGWPIWTITLAGAASLGSVVGYILTMQSE